MGKQCACEGTWLNFPVSKKQSKAWKRRFSASKCLHQVGSDAIATTSTREKLTSIMTSCVAKDLTYISKELLLTEFTFETESSGSTTVGMMSRIFPM